jgi:pyruvoyl-dependent arginine decarboxylase (PvlArgDC)
MDERGMMLRAVVSSIESEHPGATISAGIAVGRPTDQECAGVISKHSGPVPRFVFGSERVVERTTVA